MISPISSADISFSGQKAKTYPVTQKHINIVTDSTNTHLLEELDNLGLINRQMMARVKKEAALRDARSVERSIEKVADIISHPRYAIESRDNGYWFETESKYNPQDTVQSYMKGKNYTTPVFSREREYALALDNVAKKGSPKDCERIVKMFKKYSAASQTFDYVQNLRNIDKTTKLHFCIPQDGTFGKLIPLNRQNAFQFVSDTLVAPLKACAETLLARAKQSVRK